MKRLPTCILWSRDDPREYAIAEPQMVPQMLANGWTETPPTSVATDIVVSERVLQPARFVRDPDGSRIFEPEVVQRVECERAIAPPPPFVVRDVEIAVDGDALVLPLAMVDQAEVDRRLAAQHAPRRRRGTSATGDEVPR